MIISVLAFVWIWEVSQLESSKYEVDCVMGNFFCVCETKRVLRVLSSVLILCEIDAEFR